MKKLIKMLSLVLAVVLVFSSFPTIFVGSAAVAQTTESGEIVKVQDIFTILNDGTDFSTISSNSTSSKEFLVTDAVPDANGFASKLNDWTKTVLDITTDKDLYGVEAYAFYADTTQYYGTANSFNVTVTADDLAVVETNRLCAGANYVGTCYLYSMDGVLKGVYTNAVNGISIPAGFKGYVILPVVSEDDSFNYNNFTKFSLNRSGYPAWGTDEDGNTEAGLKSIILDNVSAIFDLDAFKALKPYQIGNFEFDTTSFDDKIVTEIPKAANTVDLSWHAMTDAASYKAVLYEQTEGNYYYVAEADVTTISAQFASLVPGEKYAVQILGLDSSGNVIDASYLKEFKAQQKGNYTVMNNASDMSYISTTLGDGKIINDTSIFPDGTGFTGLTKNGQSVTFINQGGAFDLAQYDAIAVYVDFPTGAPASLFFTNLTDDSGVKISNVLKDSNKTGQAYCNMYFVNDVTGAVSYPDTVDWEDGYFDIEVGDSGYFVFELSDDAYTAKKHIINEININLSQWHSNSHEANMGYPVRFDNLALIEDLDVFVSSVTKNPQKLGYSPSNTSAVPTLSGPNETNGQAYMNVVWTAMTGARSYRINVFEEVNGNLVYKTTATSVTRNVDIPIEYGENLSVQVVGLTSSGTPAIASKVAYFDNTVYVPEILGASFNDAGDIRFVGNTPAKILSSYTVKGYGAVIAPTKFLSGELTLESASTIIAAFSETPALSSQFYATVNGIGNNTDLELAARAYITYIDESGEEFTVYGTNTVVRSVDSISEKMATAVLMYYDAKQIVDTYNDGVTSSSTHLDVENISNEQLIAFAKENRNAVKKAYDLLVATGETESKFNQRIDFVYVYETDNYTYGIDRNFNEVISYKRADGTNYDVVNGGGRYTLVGTNNSTSEDETVLKNAGIKSFKQTVENGKTTLTVKYQTRGVAIQNGEMYTKYTFNENGISVDAHVKYSNSNYTLLNSKSYLGRTFLNEFSDLRKTFHTDWIYPENGDYPYKLTDSWVTIHTMDDDSYFYTFNRENTPDEIWDFYVRYPERNIPLYFEDSTSVDYYAGYDIVLRENSDKFTADNEAVFASKDSDFTAFITPVTPNDDDTSIFVGNSVNMAIDVKNIINTSNAVTTSYTVYDYYGNRVAYNTATAQLQSGGSTRYTFSVNAPTNPYGIYFVNLTVKSDKYTHTEFYTFAMLEEYTYKYNQTSPFGIVQTLNEDHTSFDNTWSIMNKVGIAKTRSAFIYSSDPDRNFEFLEKMKQKNIYSVPNGAIKEDWWNTYGSYHDVVMYGNEINLDTINGNSTVSDRFDFYYETYFTPSRTIADQFGKMLALGGVSAGQTAWYDELYNRGLWDDFDAIGLHSYGIPYAPDNVNVVNYGWSVEGGLRRTVAAQEAYGEKIIYLDETGYHNAPNLRNVELRGQSDYNIRCYILGTAYGCFYTGAYCFFDYSNGGEGTCLTDMEYHFGNFYYPDYYGRILPKPSGISYANMTRAIESVQTLVESSKYSGGTLRVFEADTALDGKVYVAWSNCAKLKNDSDYSSYQRDPSMPWENLWRASENLTITTSSKTVTVYDSMGNTKTYTASNGKVIIPITGETVFIKGA
ncbi:MAG: hypothetical protein IJN65_01970 [Clostridia bacterium]|nr:hypothetical protein [Clostridia bacterium]